MRRFHRNRVHDVDNGFETELEHRKGRGQFVHIRRLVGFHHRVTAELSNAHKELLEFDAWGHGKFLEDTQHPLLRRLVVRVRSARAFPARRGPVYGSVRACPASAASAVAAVAV
jgi:hypothetical protein